MANYFWPSKVRLKMWNKNSMKDRFQHTHKEYSQIAKLSKHITASRLNTNQPSTKGLKASTSD